MNMKLQPGNPEEVGMSSQQIQRIVNLAEGWVSQGIHPALVILVARKGKIVIHESFGRLTPEPDSPSLERDAIFPLASITKPITATAAMILVEEGLLGLNRPVMDYIPEFIGDGKNAVMVHHLLTHTSGLNWTSVDGHAANKKLYSKITLTDVSQYPWSRDYEMHPLLNEYMNLRSDAPLWKKPGIEMSYADFNYELLAEIVRRVSGKSLFDFTIERIFTPLGMKDTYYGIPESVQHRVVKRPADAVCAEWIDIWMNSQCGSDGSISTAMDIAIFGQMFLNRGSYGDVRILSPASVTEMTRNQIPGISSRFGEEFFPEAGWGFGWGIQENKKAGGSLSSPKAFAHGGAGGVFLGVDPIYEIVGVYFAIDHLKRTCFDLFSNAVMAAVLDA